MAEPRIQYAKTTDGVNIAFWSLGSGPPLVALPFIYSHLQLEWQQPEIRAWYERLSQNRQLVRYDMRGMGMSDRDVPDLSINGQLRDLDAVIERLELPHFDVLGFAHGVPFAITYASRNPEQVSRLILWCGYSHGSEWTQSPRIQAVRASISQDWETASEAIAHVLLGWSAGESARHYAELVRESTTPENVRNYLSSLDQIDVRPLLPEIRAQTLILQRDKVAAPLPRAGQGLASGIPSARLIMLNGSSLAPYLGDAEAVLVAIEDFLNDGTPQIKRLASGTAIILFADIVDSTALTERLGDTAFRERARKLDEAMRVAIREGGTAIEGKLLGDGVLAVFTSARDAIAASLTCRDASRDADLEIHVGLHAGDVIREENNVYGGAVNIAARISSLSAPGEVLVSRTVTDLARTSAGVSFEDRGEHVLKGVAEPHRVFAVRRIRG